LAQVDPSRDSSVSKELLPKKEPLHNQKDQEILSKIFHQDAQIDSEVGNTFSLAVAGHCHVKNIQSPEQKNNSFNL